MKVNILFFGVLTDIVKSNTMSIEDTPTVKELLTSLETKFPALKQYRYLIAVNQDISSVNQPLKEGDEVALLPPYAGG